MRLPETILFLYQKELVCLFRDKDIILYGILIPLLLFPCFSLLAFEGGLWCMGMCENHKYLVAVSADEVTKQAIEASLKEEKMFQLVADSEPEQHLRDGSVDFFVKKDGTSLVLYRDALRDPLNIVQPLLKHALEAACKSSVDKIIQENHLPASTAQVFSVNRSYLNENRTVQPTQWTPLQTCKYCGACVFILLFVETSVTAAPAMALPMVNEIEQRTVITTLLMPVSRVAVGMAKYLAGLTVTFLSAFEFIVSFIIAIVAMALVTAVQMRGTVGHQHHHMAAVPSPHNTSTTLGEVFGAQLSSQWASGPSMFDLIGIVFIDIILFGLATACSCAILFAVGSWARTSKEAQMLVSIPGTVLAATPIIALLPFANLNVVLASIPIVNLFFVMKEVHGSHLAAFAILENIVLVFAFLWLAGYLAALRSSLVGLIWRKAT